MLAEYAHFGGPLYRSPGKSSAVCMHYGEYLCESSFGGKTQNSFASLVLWQKTDSVEKSGGGVNTNLQQQFTYSVAAKRTGIVWNRCQCCLLIIRIIPPISSLPYSSGCWFIDNILVLVRQLRKFGICDNSSELANSLFTRERVI